MTLREKLTKKGLFPDISGIQQDLNQKFDQLYSVLVEIRDLLKAQRGT
jgi:hypothetical protein